MLDQISKNVAVKFVNSTKSTQNLVLMPGTTTRDVLQELGLGAGFQLGDARNDTVFPPDDVLFARVHDGDLLHVSAMVDAGC